MRRLQRIGGVVLLVLWGLAPALHLHHILEHHLSAHHAVHGCSHHNHAAPDFPGSDHSEGVAASDACDLCDWQWAPADESAPAAFNLSRADHIVEVKLGRTSPPLTDDLVNSDHHRRGPPAEIRTV